MQVDPTQAAVYPTGAPPFLNMSETPSGCWAGADVRHVETELYPKGSVIRSRTHAPEL